VSKPNKTLFFGTKNAIHQTLPSTLGEPPPYETSESKSRTSNVNGISDVGLTPESDNSSSSSPLPVQSKDSHFAYGRG